jgi:hypothetical protein
MTKRQVTAIVSVLNQYHRCDPKAVRSVLKFRHSINQHLKETDIIARDEGGGVESVSALGVLNSCLGSWRIGINIDPDDPEPFRVVKRVVS